MRVLLLISLASVAWAQPQPFEAGERWGYKSGDAVVIAPTFLMAEPFSKGGLAAVVDDQGWALINAKGSVVLRPFVVDNGPDAFADGLARFVEDGRVGFHDPTGKVIIPARFDFAEPFKGGRARFCVGCVAQKSGEYTTIVGGHWGYIDRKVGR